MAAHRGLKNVCFENANLWYVVVLQSVHMCRQCLAGEVLYEILGFVSSYDFDRCALLLLMYFCNFVVPNIRGDCYVG